jgi:hypothetical protein
MFYDRDRHLFLQAYSAVAARGSIDLRVALMLLVGNFGARYRGSSARHFHHVARLRADALHIRRRHAGNRAPHILHASFRYA